MNINSNFKNSFIHTLISSNFNHLSESINHYLPTPIAYSIEAAEHLIYLKAADRIEAPGEFHYTQKNFHSYCIIHTLSGCGVLQRNKEAYSISQGSLCFIDCRYEHSIRASSAWEYQILFFDGYPVSYYHSTFTDSAFPVLTLPKNSSVPQLITKLVAQNFMETELMNAKLLTDLLTHIITIQRNDLIYNKNLPVYLVQIKDAFDKNFDTPFSLDELSDYYQVNKFRICREFKKQFGISPMQYLNSVRLQSAKELLKNSNLSVSEISYQVGFETPNHFIQLFKKDSGVTPAVYRKHSIL